MTCAIIQIEYFFRRSKADVPAEEKKKKKKAAEKICTKSKRVVKSERQSKRIEGRTERRKLFRKENNDTFGCSSALALAPSPRRAATESKWKAIRHRAAPVERSHMPAPSATSNRAHRKRRDGSTEGGKSRARAARPAKSNAPPKQDDSGIWFIRGTRL